MELKSDVIRIAPATHTPDGKPLEPEERPAERVIATGAPLSFSTGQKISDSFPSVIHEATTAGAIAQGVRRLCQTCEYFDNPGWMEFKNKAIVGSKEDRELINEIRYAIDYATSQDAATRAMHEDETDGSLDLEHALNAMGFCRAMTEVCSRFEMKFSPQIVHPHASCPDMQGPNGESFSNLYKPRKGAPQSEAAKAYDAIMRAAQHKQ